MFDFLKPKVPRVTVADLKHALDAKELCILLDVRTPGEYAKGKIAGSINLPTDDVAARIRSVMPDQSAKTYVYCLSGSRSAHAVDAMAKLGYTNVFDVSNGLLAWRASNFPVVP